MSTLNELAHRVVKSERRLQDLLELARLTGRGELTKELLDVVADIGITGHQSIVGIYASGSCMVVSTWQKTRFSGILAIQGDCANARSCRFSDIAEQTGTAGPLEAVRKCSLFVAGRMPGQDRSPRRPATRLKLSRKRL